MAKVKIAQAPPTPTFLIEPLHDEGDLDTLVRETVGFARLSNLTLSGWLAETEGSIPDVDGPEFALVREIAWHADQRADLLARAWAAQRPARAV